MSFNYAKLRGKIRECYKTQEHFAKALGISGASLSAKLNNNVEFSQTEITKALQLLSLKQDDIQYYFFSLRVQEAEQKHKSE